MFKMRLSVIYYMHPEKKNINNYIKKCTYVRGLKEVTGWKNTYPHTVSYKVPQNPCPISYPKSHVLIWHPECIYVCKIRRYIWSKILQTFANFFDTHIFTRCMLICRCDGPKELGSEDGVREKSRL